MGNIRVLCSDRLCARALNYFGGQCGGAQTASAIRLMIRHRAGSLRIETTSTKEIAMTDHTRLIPNKSAKPEPNPKSKPAPTAKPDPHAGHDMSKPMAPPKPATPPKSARKN